MRRSARALAIGAALAWTLACGGLGIELPPELEELLGEIPADGDTDTPDGEDGEEPDDGEEDGEEDGDEGGDTDTPDEGGDTDTPDDGEEGEDGDDGEEDGGEDAEEPEPEPEPEPAPRPRPSGGQVNFTGANNVRLVSGNSKTKLPARLPAGTYKVQAQFSAGDGPTAAGEVTLSGSGTTTIACNARMRLCKVQ